jgi:hypothetical protein
MDFAKEKVNIFVLMEVYIQAILFIAFLTDMEIFLTKMERNIWDNGKIVFLAAKEKLIIQMEAAMKVFLKIIKNMEKEFILLMLLSILECFLRIILTV